MEFTTSSTAPAPPAPAPPASSATAFKVEAESYTQMNGIQTEPTYDPMGGGQNVGWINQGDWMDYSIAPTAAGTYTVTFRIASEAHDAQLQLRKSDGTVLQTVAVQNTFGYQTWRSITSTVVLTAGQQTLRLYSSGAGGFNINWMEFVPQTNATTAAKSVGTAEVEGESEEALLSVFPELIEERFMVSSSTTLTGKMTLQLISEKGTVVKTYTLQKSSEGPLQSYLSAEGVTPGSYTLKMTIGSLTETLSVTKQ
jgi:endoglucanase